MRTPASSAQEGRGRQRQRQASPGSSSRRFQMLSCRTTACGGRPKTCAAGLAPPKSGLQVGRVGTVGRGDWHRRHCDCCRRCHPPPARGRRQDPKPDAPVVGCTASSLGGSTTSSSRPRSEVEVEKAAPLRCSSVGSDCCRQRTSAMAMLRAARDAEKRRGAAGGRSNSAVDSAALLQASCRKYRVLRW